MQTFTEHLAAVKGDTVLLFCRIGGLFNRLICSCSYCLVTSSPRSFSERWRNCGSMHPLLEYSYRATHAICWYWITSVQFGLVQTFFWISKHPRLLPESDSDLEISEPCSSGAADGAFVPCTLLGHVSRWRIYRYRRRRWNTPLLECLQQNSISKGNAVGAESIHQSPVDQHLLVSPPRPFSPPPPPPLFFGFKTENKNMKKNLLYIFL